MQTTQISLAPECEQLISKYISEYIHSKLNTIDNEQITLDISINDFATWLDNNQDELDAPIVKSILVALGIDYFKKLAFRSI